VKQEYWPAGSERKRVRSSEIHMDTMRVKDLMIPLGSYAVISVGSTLEEAVEALERSQQNLPAGRLPHRAVLVRDDSGKIVGKIGQFALLKALEPKYNVLGDLETVRRPGVDSQVLSAMMEHLQLFENSLSDHCRYASKLKVEEVMTPVSAAISEDASLAEAIHRIVVWQTMSILVARGAEIVGVLRLSDLFDEACRNIRTSTNEEN
jgi:CBS domain-containing protein